MAERAFDFIARSHDPTATGSVIPGAQGRLLYPGPRLRLRRHDPRGAGALRGDRRARAISTRRWPGSARFDAHYANPDNGGYFLTADDAEGLVVRPAATSDDATPNPNAHRRAKSGAARGADRRRRHGASRPTGCSTACWPAPPTICCSTRRCSTRSTCGCARPRSSSPGRTHAALRRGRAQAAVPRPHRAARAVRRRAAGQPSGAGQDRGGIAERGVRLRRRDLLAAGDRSGQNR